MPPTMNSLLFHSVRQLSHLHYTIAIIRKCSPNLLDWRGIRACDHSLCATRQTVLRVFARGVCFKMSSIAKIVLLLLYAL